MKIDTRKVVTECCLEQTQKWYATECLRSMSVNIKNSLFLFYYRKSNGLELWKVLCECAAEGWLLNFHDGNKVSMNINGIFSEWFNIK